METNRKLKLMWRWSLFVSCLFAIFWAIWYLVVGQVPITTEVVMTPGWTFQLPFGVSRLWDIPLSAVITALIILVATAKPFNDSSDLAAGLVFGLGFSIRYICAATTRFFLFHIKILPLQSKVL